MHKYIEYLHETEFSEQKQLPNPTVIKSVATSQDDLPGGLTLVFSAYLQEKYTSKENEGIEENPAKKCWYPTIFFYDLRKDKVVWEIFGAEQFIHIDRKNRVTVLTNEVWIETTSQKYR